LRATRLRLKNGMQGRHSALRRGAGVRRCIGLVAEKAAVASVIETFAFETQACIVICRRNSLRSAA